MRSKASGGCFVELALREVTRTYVVRHDIPVLALELATGDDAREVLSISTTSTDMPTIPRVE